MNGVIKFTHELNELIELIKMSKANDGKIRLFEKIAIGKKIGSVISHLPEVKKDVEGFASMTDSELEQFSVDLSKEGKHININLNPEDLKDALISVQGVTKIIQRNKK